MKVKVIKLDERYLDYATDERYHNMYALGLEDGVWFLPAFWCEVVEETNSFNEFE